MVSYTLLLSLIEYKTLVLREDMEAAQQLLPTIPKVRSFFLTRIMYPTWSCWASAAATCGAYLPLFRLMKAFVDGSTKRDITACMANVFMHAVDTAMYTSKTHKQHV